MRKMEFRGPVSSFVTYSVTQLVTGVGGASVGHVLASHQRNLGISEKRYSFSL